jgi:drug/metabolite transporter (DMT)-like permease
MPCGCFLPLTNCPIIMPDTRRNGYLFALSGFALLSMGDAVIKTIAGEWPGTAVAAIRFCLGAAGLGALLWIKEGNEGFKLPLPGIQLLRGAALAVATLCFFSSIFLMPMAEAVAIQFTSPVITAVFSGLFLRERSSKYVWAATFAAFAGVLMILRPNLAVLGWAAFLPLISSFAMALMMMGNRRVATAGSPLLMQFLVAAIAAPILVIAALAGHIAGPAALRIGPPDLTIIIRCACVAVTASTSHWLVYMGTMRASAAQIAPAQYIQILVAMMLGVLFFGDLPDGLSLAGSIIIISAGLMLWRINSAKALPLSAD